MNSEIAWVLVSSGTQVQPQKNTRSWVEHSMYAITKLFRPIKQLKNHQTVAASFLNLLGFVTNVKKSDQFYGLFSSTIILFKMSRNKLRMRMP